MEISKLEAASRLLDTAIRLFFESADAVAVHSLAAASLNVFSDVAEHRGISWRTYLGEDSNLSPQEVKHTLNKAWNFFKHADRLKRTADLLLPSRDKATFTPSL